MGVVDSYTFGKIVVDGKTYTSDVIVGRDVVKEGWWRREGHRVKIEDLEEILKLNPEVVVFGTGANGRLKVEKEVREFLESKGVKVYEFETSKAVEVFNRLIGKGVNAVLAAHLTC